MDVGNTIESETKNLTKETLAEAAEKQKEEVVRIIIKEKGIDN